MDNNTILNVFLVIASVAIILVTILVAVFIFNLILLLRAVRMAANKAEQAAKIVSEDLREFGTKFKKEGFSFKLLWKFISAILFSSSSKKINKK